MFAVNVMIALAAAIASFVVAQVGNVIVRIVTLVVIIVKYKIALIDIKYKLSLIPFLFYVQVIAINYYNLIMLII